MNSIRFLCFKEGYFEEENMLRLAYVNDARFVCVKEGYFEKETCLKT